MTETDEKIISNALNVFIYTNDLLCNPTAYDLKLMELNYNNVVATWVFCNLFFSEYISNIENIQLMLDRNLCKSKTATAEDHIKNTHLFSIKVDVNGLATFMNDNVNDEGFINFIENNKNKILIGPVGVSYPWGLHETALIIDPSRKTIEYFDPMYDINDNAKVIYKKVNQVLNKQILLPGTGWTWYSMEHLGNHPGWQTMSEPFRKNDTALTQDYIVGYCVSWCILYAILKSIVSYAPNIVNTGEMILRLFPTVAYSFRPSDDMGLTMHIIIRNFALELVLSLFEKDQNHAVFGLKDSQEKRIEPKEYSCGIDRITHATQEIIKQLRKENMRLNSSPAHNTKSKNVLPPTPYFQTNIVSHPNLFKNTNSTGFDFTVPNNNEGHKKFKNDESEYFVGYFNIKPDANLNTVWNNLSNKDKQDFNNFLTEQGLNPLPTTGFITKLL